MDTYRLGESKRPRKVEEKFKSKAVKRLVYNSLNTESVKTEYERVKKRIEEGVHPTKIGKELTNVPGPGQKVLIKASNTRYLVEVSADKVEILELVVRGNQQKLLAFKELMNEIYGVKLKYFERTIYFSKLMDQQLKENDLLIVTKI